MACGKSLSKRQTLKLKLELDNEKLLTLVRSIQKAGGAMAWINSEDINSHIETIEYKRSVITIRNSSGQTVSNEI
jgi:hypothetical protein